MTHMRRLAPACLGKAMLAGAVACMLGGAHAATPAFFDDLKAEIVPGLHLTLVWAFTLDERLALDPALRAAADKIGKEHVARIDKLLPAWVDEERLRQSGVDDPVLMHYVVSYALNARLLNELALWQLEPGDAHYEDATLTALRDGSGVCDASGDKRLTVFASRILRIQALPEAECEAMLASERLLLTHWGLPRAGLAPWPDPLPQQAAYALLQRGPADVDHPRLPLPPILAYHVFGKGEDYTGLNPWERCVLQQWWLRESLRLGVAPAAALNGFRYGTMPAAVGHFDDAWDKPDAADVKDRAGPPPYPSIARHYNMSGFTTVSVQLDAEGKPLQAAVTGREITVSGIRGVRPVAFENVFDAASVAYATQAGRRYDKPPGGGPYKFRMAWSLDDDDKKANAPKGAKQ
jgi:hypothetical protein